MWNNRGAQNALSYHGAITRLLTENYPKTFVGSLRLVGTLTSLVQASMPEDAHLLREKTSANFYIVSWQGLLATYKRTTSTEIISTTEERT